MSDGKQYPAWQKEFRAMQTVRDENYARAQAKAREEEAEEERQVGLNLAKALMHFGIYLETAPGVNDVEIDGYRFRLSNRQYRSLKSDAANKEWFDFTLSVIKAIPGRSGEDDDPVHYRRISVNTRNMPENGGWDYYLCQLADAFDELDKSVAYDVARDAERKQRAEARAALPDAPEVESDADKLLTLLRAIIREELSNQLES